MFEFVDEFKHFFKIVIIPVLSSATQKKTLASITKNIVKNSQNTFEEKIVFSWGKFSSEKRKKPDLSRDKIMRNDLCQGMTKSGCIWWVINTAKIQ